MASFETLIKNKSVSPYTKELVGNEKENGTQQLKLIKFDGNTFVDISKIGTTEKQLNFIKNCIRYFAKPSINIVVLIEIYDRNVSAGGNYKAVAVVFQRNISTVDPTSIISFGSQQLTEYDINKYNTLSHNNTPITGTLHNNHNLNNIQNNPIYWITIDPPSLFLNTPLPVGMVPFVIDLFNIKQVMDRISKFSATE
ncbi:hypothetical protein ACTFIZ_003238 [Dictyostelium cf. discoideum]